VSVAIVVAKSIRSIAKRVISHHFLSFGRGNLSILCTSIANFNSAQGWSMHIDLKRIVGEWKDCKRRVRTIKGKPNNSMLYSTKKTTTNVKFPSVVKNLLLTCCPFE
jgi:hypothetical protein